MSEAGLALPITVTPLLLANAGRWGVIGLLIFTIVFWGVVLLGIVLLIRWGTRSTRVIARARVQEALDILQRRYAMGEITSEEFEERRRNILSSAD